MNTTSTNKRNIQKKKGQISVLLQTNARLLGTRVHIKNNMNENAFCLSIPL